MASLNYPSVLNVANHSGTRVNFSGIWTFILEQNPTLALNARSDVNNEIIWPIFAHTQEKNPTVLKLVEINQVLETSTVVNVQELLQGDVITYEGKHLLTTMINDFVLYLEMISILCDISFSFFSHTSRISC